MLCPNCQTVLELEKINSVVYYFCAQCNSFWFDNKDTDFLTLAEAEALYEKFPPKSRLMPNKPYQCPNCQKELEKTDYSYQCYNCGGVLTNAQVLLKEKVQLLKKSKLEAPFSVNQLKGVVLLGFITLFVGVNYFILNKINQNKINNTTRASVLGSNLHVKALNNGQLLVLLTTDDPYYSTAHLIKKNGDHQVININNKLSLTHLLNISLPKKGTMLYIELIDLSGKIIQKLPIKIPNKEP